MSDFLVAAALRVSVLEVPEVPEHYVRKAWAFIEAVRSAKIHKANEQKGVMVSLDVTDLLPM